ncbi:MAG: ATP-binding protein [Desulfobacterales bacterium]|nr:ATP-binding protein [Desulfobacterales bacterium]
MERKNENEYLLKAINAFKRKIIVISPDFNILAINNVSNQTWENDTVGKSCYHALYGRTSHCLNCPAVNVLETKKPTMMDRKALTNEDKMLCRYSYPILSGDNIDALVILDFEFPALEGLEERLKRSNSFLRNLILSSVDGVIAADMKGKLLIFNDSAAEISGHKVEEALHKLNIRDVYPGDGAREVMKKLRSDDHGGKGKLKSYIVDVLGKNCENIPISLNASIVYEEEREVATIGFFHDLRETLRMKKELEKAQIQILQSEKMASLGKLAAGVAHQLNNPLSSITLFTQLVLEEYKLEEGARDDLTRVYKEAQRCRDTVKELLEFARQTRQEMRPHDVNSAILRTVFLLENQTLFHNIEIEKDLSPSLPEVYGDIQQLNHIFMNVILNAADAMEGKGKLSIKSYKPLQSDTVIIEISDTGPGIPQNVLPHIFEPFFTTKEEGKGTGLGLSLVYSMIDNHKGRIYAKSWPGKGTTFVIELPTAKFDEEGIVN